MNFKIWFDRRVFDTTAISFLMGYRNRTELFFFLSYFWCWSSVKFVCVRRHFGEGRWECGFPHKTLGIVNIVITLLFYVVVVVLCSQVYLSCAAHQCHDMKRRSAALIHRYYIVPSSMRSFFIFVHVTEGGFVEPWKNHPHRKKTGLVFEYNRFTRERLSARDSL